MPEFAVYLLMAAFTLLLIGWLANLVALNSAKVVTVAEQKEAVTVGAQRAGGKDGQEAETAGVPGSAPGSGKATRVRHMGVAAKIATGATVLALVLLTVYIVMRSVVTGHAPFTNQHEFAIAFVWAIVACYLVFEWRYDMRAISLVAIGIAAALLLYGLNLDTGVRPLMPALQNNPMLTLHVGTAMLSYGATCISFGAAVLYLIRPYVKWRGMPSGEVLDEVSYRAAVIAYPLITAMIILGAVWAQTAWGRYWGWDPKETAALITWLIWSAYLHARVFRGWRGRRAAWLVVIGFASVLFAYFGNHFFGGLHSYA
ncbi:MAG TPA: c-type cytochrome biogenesis protein CcsB [Actinomycetaceae bacterium]|nr:c-type cytochrome biogenesis protein CcsB [Actinomycetaceae bacterium]